MNKRQRARRSTQSPAPERTYTKTAVKALLIIGVINAEVPFILSAFGKDPVVTLGVAWITEIVAVILGYMLKAYFAKKEEEKTRLKEMQMNFTTEYDNGIKFANVDDDMEVSG